MDMVCTIWRATFGNGVLTGMVKITTVTPAWRTQKDRAGGVNVFCGEVGLRYERPACSLPLLQLSFGYPPL